MIEKNRCQLLDIPVFGGFRDHPEPIYESNLNLPSYNHNLTLPEDRGAATRMTLTTKYTNLC